MGLITPNNKLQTTPFTLITTGIKQECDGKKAKVLLEVEHNKKPLVLEVRSATSVTFDEDEELMVV